MKYISFLLLLLSVNHLNSMSPERSSRLALIPFVQPESCRIIYSGCFRCQLTHESYAKQQEQDASSNDKLVLEESFVCASQRIRNNQDKTVSELLNKIDVNRWNIFKLYVEKFYSGNTQTAIKILQDKCDGLHSDICKRRKCLLTQIDTLTKEALMLEGSSN